MRKRDDSKSFLTPGEKSEKKNEKVCERKKIMLLRLTFVLLDWK